MIALSGLSTASQGAVREAAGRVPEGSPVTTGMVLTVLSLLSGGKLSRIWLNTGDPETLTAGRVRDETPPGSLRWEGMLISGALASALVTLEKLSSEYGLDPAPAGLLLLALVCDPASGAARVLTGDGQVAHERLLVLIQEEALGLTLEGLDPSAGSGSDLGSRLGSAPNHPSDTGLDRYFDAARRNTAGPKPDELDLMGALVDDPATAMIMDRLKIDKATLEVLETPARRVGVTPVARLRAPSLEGGPTCPEDLLILLAAQPSPGLRLLMGAVGVNARDLEVEARDQLDEKAGHDRRPGRAVLLFLLANVLLCLVASILTVLGVVHGGSVWSLLLIPLMWAGVPQLPPLVPAAVAVVTALTVGPPAGVAMTAAAVLDWLSYRAQRAQILQRTGISLPFLAWQRFALCRTTSGDLLLTALALLRLSRTLKRMRRQGLIS
jgi:hypothetical protein